MKGPRGLSASEAALWRRVAATVVPLDPSARLPGDETPLPSKEPPETDSRRPARRAAAPVRSASPAPTQPQPTIDRRTLDGTWDRRLAHGLVAPDAEIDLHGMGLDQAHGRLMASIAQARAMGARVLLVIAGKQRPHDEHDARGQRRGAIRAKLIDWLAASAHAGAIAAIRPAHQRHGGAGAVYVVLRRAPGRSG